MLSPSDAQAGARLSPGRKSRPRERSQNTPRHPSSQRLSQGSNPTTDQATHCPQDIHSTSTALPRRLLGLRSSLAHLLPTCEGYSNTSSW